MARCPQCGHFVPSYDCQHCPEKKIVVCVKCGGDILVLNEYYVK